MTDHYGMPLKSTRVTTPKSQNRTMLNQTQKDSSRLMKPTVKRIGVDLNSKPKKSIRLASRMTPMTKMAFRHPVSQNLPYPSA